MTERIVSLLWMLLGDYREALEEASVSEAHRQGVLAARSLLEVCPDLTDDDRELLAEVDTYWAANREKFNERFGPSHAWLAEQWERHRWLRPL